MEYPFHVYVIWFVIIIIITILALYALRPSCLKNSRKKGDTSFMNPISVLIVAFFVSVILLALMCAIMNYT